MDIVTRKVYSSRHVQVDETQFPFQHISGSKALQQFTSSQSTSIPISLTFSLFPGSPCTLAYTPHHSSMPTFPTTSPIPPSPAITSRTSHQILTSFINIHHLTTTSKYGIFKPKAYVATKHLIPTHIPYDYVPSTYLQASKHPTRDKQRRKNSMPYLALALGHQFHFTLLKIGRL